MDLVKDSCNESPLGCVANLAWSEIGRLDDQIERDQVKLSICRHQIKRLTDLLKENNIPVPDLAAEAKLLEKERLVSELKGFKEDLADFEQRIKEAMDKDGKEGLDEDEKEEIRICKDEKWCQRHRSYLERNIKKLSDRLNNFID